MEVQRSLQSVSLCDFVCLLKSDSTASNIAALDNEEVFGVELGFSDTSDLGVWSKYFENAPSNRLIFIEASGMALGAVLLLASVNRRSVHIAQVTRGSDLAIIQASKAHGVDVTCDVNPVLLSMRSDAEIASSSFKGASIADVDALWAGIADIDCFSTGRHATAWLDKAVSLMVTAMHAGRLTMEDIISRFHTNPSEILGLYDESRDTYVEVDVDAVGEIEGSGMFAEPRQVKGRICRVVVRDQVVFVDGVISVAPGSGNFLKSVNDLTDLGSEAAVSSRRPRVRAAKPERRQKNVTVVDPQMETDSSRKRLASSRSSDHEASESRHRRTSSSTSGIARPVALVQRTENVLQVSQYSRNDLRQLFLLASELRGMTDRISTFNILQGKILVNAFYEPSTRTSCSFQAAMKRLGGEVVNVNVPTSSVSKGETLADTIRTLQCYGDAIVLRHPGKGSAAEAAEVADVPIINAGDGTGEHPTQALLDVYTIREELGTVNGLTITIVGDLKHGRTTHSLARLLRLYNVTVNYVSLPSLKMPADIKEELAAAGVRQNECVELDDVIATTDVLYVTRIQEERFEDKNAYRQACGKYVVTPASLKRAKSNMIIMHPLPRVDEISREVDYDQRAAYFRQMKYGLYVRMALLTKLLGKSEWGSHTTYDA